MRMESRFHRDSGAKKFLYWISDLCRPAVFRNLFGAFVPSHGVSIGNTLVVWWKGLGDPVSGVGTGASWKLTSEAFWVVYRADLVDRAMGSIVVNSVTLGC